MKRFYKFKKIRTRITVSVMIAMVVSAFLTAVLFMLGVNFKIIPPAARLSFWFSLIIMCVSGLMGTVIASFFVSFFLMPVNEMVRATEKVASGDFSVRLKRMSGIAELKNLQDNFNSMVGELAGNEMLKEDFINNFSHEFKTPIVSIRGFARQLEKKGLSEEKREQYIRIIAEESERLADMAANVLLLTKLENQEIVTEKEEFALDEQIRDCVLLFEKILSDKNITVEAELEEFIFSGNKDMISHVWRNILHNSIKFTPEGGHINVIMKSSEDSIAVEISDTGKGMPNEVLDHIFDKFYQGESAHSGEGNGLGMSLVKRIVLMCGGRIIVKSEVGAGTTVTVILYR